MPDMQMIRACAQMYPVEFSVLVVSAVIMLPIMVYVSISMLEMLMEG